MVFRSFLLILCIAIVNSHLKPFKPWLYFNNNRIRKAVSKILKTEYDVLMQRLSTLTSIVSTRTDKILSYLSKINNSTNIEIKNYDFNNEDKEFFDKLDEHNKEAMNLLRYLYNQKDGWKLVANKNDFLVERKYLSAGSFVSKSDADKGNKHACVRSTAIIKGNPKDIFELFLDIDRVSEYNEHVSSLKDVYFFKNRRNDDLISKNNISTGNNNGKSHFALGLPPEFDSSKMSYATGYRMGPFKARDFLSIVNFVKYPDNSYVILNRPAYYSKIKSNKKYVRATILLAGNIIEPYDKDKSLLTLIAHVNPGGISDTKAAAWIINKLCALGPPKFIKAVEKSVNK